MGATTRWGDNDSTRVSHCIWWGGPRAPQREPLRRPRQSPEGYAPGSRRSRRPPPLPHRPWATSQCPAPPPAPASAAPQAEQPYPRPGPQAPWCPHDPHGAPRCPHGALRTGVATLARSRNPSPPTSQGPEGQRLALCVSQLLRQRVA